MTETRIAGSRETKSANDENAERSRRSFAQMGGAFLQRIRLLRIFNV